MSTASGLALRFLGVGGAQSPELGSASVVVEQSGAPILMVDCGQEAFSAWMDRYSGLPPAIFITHAHLDHVAGLERVFYRAWFDEHWRGRIRLFLAADLVGVLQSRIANYPSPLAEGGVNFWDAFQLVPCERGFWWQGLWFDVFAVRHHAPRSAFGIALRGSFLFTGDTRPIPEQLSDYVDGRAVIAHDCALQGNPSHTGLADVLAEYPAEWRDQMLLYHYSSEGDGEAMRAAGFRVARAGDLVCLAAPDPAMWACGRAFAPGARA